MSKWKMVPLEPTDEMIHAIDGLICSSYLWPVYAYRAMIDAAPVQQTDPLGYFTFNKEWNVWEQMSAKYKNASDATPLYLHPPSAELARLRAENERLTGALDNILARTHDGSSYRMAQDIYQTAIGALVPTAPPAR